MSSINLQDVGKTYPGENKPAVESISLEIASGEFFCLVGPSGCGKTTILKLIIGLEKPTSGEITAPEQISMVFQSGALLPWLTVEQNVAFGLKMAGKSNPTAKNESHKFLQMVNLLPFKEKYPRELSGGQRQRVGIARALAIEPEVLLLDEPFSALDPLTTEELHKDLLAIWKQTKITIVMVSHLIEEAVLLSDRIGIMENGRIRNVMSINLKRPRENFGKDFMDVTSKIKSILR